MPYTTTSNTLKTSYAPPTPPSYQPFMLPNLTHRWPRLSHQHNNPREAIPHAGHSQGQMGKTILANLNAQRSAPPPAHTNDRRDSPKRTCSGTQNASDQPLHQEPSTHLHRYQLPPPSTLIPPQRALWCTSRSQPPITPTHAYTPRPWPRTAYCLRRGQQTPNDHHKHHSETHQHDGRRRISHPAAQGSRRYSPWGTTRASPRKRQG